MMEILLFLEQKEKNLMNYVIWGKRILIYGNFVIVLIEWENLPKDSEKKNSKSPLTVPIKAKKNSKNE